MGPGPRVQDAAVVDGVRRSGRTQRARHAPGLRPQAATASASAVSSRGRGETRHDVRTARPAGTSSSLRAGDHSAALGHLLVVLRARGATAESPLSTTPVAEELRRYDEYMAHARGLATKTRSTALRIVGRLLLARFGDGVIDIAAIRPDHVRRFFAQQAELYSKPASAGAVVACLRGYFRYRASLGDLVHGLIGAVSYPANWSLSSLPKTLTAEEVEPLVGSPRQPGRSMRCADAIVHRALDLGLRSGEVARLSLNDIDWRAGTITLRRTKGRREDLLPLPVTTGEAIAAHLKHERPKTSIRALFVRNVATRDEPVGPDLVRKTCSTSRWEGSRRTSRRRWLCYGPGEVRSQ